MASYDSEPSPTIALTSAENMSPAVESVLAMVRREILLIAVALQTSDNLKVMVAAARLNWALEYAREFAGRSPTVMARLRSRFEMIHSLLRSWQADGSLTNMVPGREQAQGAFAMVSDPYLRGGAVLASDTLIQGLDLDDLPLSGMQLRNAKLLQVTARRARLDNIDATGSTVTQSCFDGASMRHCKLAGARVVECSLSRANFEGANWNGATVVNCVSKRALWFHARIVNSEFVDCDFVDSDFHGFPDTGTDARFVRCDLRGTRWQGRDLFGASFIGCKLYGVSGRVAGLGLARFDDNDLSPDGDGSLIVTQEELVTRWRQGGLH
jgi:uncharacterized protein YjbI with pentapeptide repeats